MFRGRNGLFGLVVGVIKNYVLLGKTMSGIGPGDVGDDVLSSASPKSSFSAASPISRGLRAGDLAEDGINSGCRSRVVRS